MSYRQIKWLILIIPTLTIALWEFVRHEYLLHMISMNMGNWLTPVIVFLITMTFLRKLFLKMERMQEELQHERLVKASLEEREKLARELHDGVAQSLFLLSVKVDQLENNQPDQTLGGDYQPLRKTVQEMNEYVRQAISSLRYAPVPDELPWLESIHRLLKDFELETGIEVHQKWSLPEKILSPKEKVELYAYIREVIINIRKHAEARQCWIHMTELEGGFSCKIEDDGKGFDVKRNISHTEGKFGLQIMRERVEKMGWKLDIDREAGKTTLHLRKGGDTHHATVKNIGD